ncbi:extracellular solute-binding protein [Paenibacillus sp. 1011MAR3C5]|uniref:extracellular solute-binding protein n=1 Tax=Paenibacillus sp. 1011MAR3C5 TaxID=1675787 RepID=UPI000E6B65C4|nr:extracellular solute-binding protein [Paenibacillus sp. 1011MAR3C5]RJE86847.1 extracellular solute-binding protein [Paenibacillus sp. 1011MAR3C5]
MKSAKFKWFSALLLLALLMQGCSAIGIGKDKKEEITLKVLASSQEFPLYMPLLNEKFPHISFQVIDVYRQMVKEGIELERWDERLVEIIEEEKPDFHMEMPPDHFIEDYPMLDMAPLLTRDRVELNDIQKQFTESQLNAKGKLTLLSPTFDRELLFVNRKLYRELGVTEPGSPMTWDQFRQSALAIQAKDSSATGYKINRDWYYSYTWVGENILGLQRIENNQLMINNLEWRQLFEQLYEDTFKNMIKSQQMIVNNPNLTHTGLYIGRASHLKTILKNNETSDDWALIELPRDPSSTWSSSVYTSTKLSIYAESPYSDEAWDIVKYLMSKEAAERIASDNLAEGFVTYPDYLDIGDFSLEPLLATGSSGSISAIELVQPAEQALSDVFRTQFEAVSTGILSFDQAWEAVDKVVQDINSKPDNFVNS